MSVKMDEDRIKRWKCLFCGSTSKRKADAIRTDGEIIGYSIMCCNCGHLDNFATQPSKALPMFICGVKNDVKEIKITCALDDDSVEFCKNKKCIYRPSKEKESTNKSPSITTDNTKNSDMVIERKYQ